jgi:hypothetical protein
VEFLRDNRIFKKALVQTFSLPNLNVCFNTCIYMCIYHIHIYVQALKQTFRYGNENVCTRAFLNFLLSRKNSTIK